jgi:hypothetical protein
LEVTALDRWNGKPLETTYQRAYCTRPYGKTRPAETTLGRSADLGGEDSRMVARKKLWQTTYEDAFSAPFPTSVLSLSGAPSVQPEPPDVAVTTQSAIKARSITSRSTFARSAGITLARSSSGKRTAGDPRWSADA